MIVIRVISLPAPWFWVGCSGEMDLDTEGPDEDDPEIGDSNLHLLIILVCFSSLASLPFPFSLPPLPRGKTLIHPLQTPITPSLNGKLPSTSAPTSSVEGEDEEGVEEGVDGTYSPTRQRSPTRARDGRVRESGLYVV